MSSAAEAFVASSTDGHMDFLRLQLAVAEGGHAARLIQETVDRIVALKDPDRLAAFHRALSRALRSRADE